MKLDLPPCPREIDCTRYRLLSPMNGEDLGYVTDENCSEAMYRNGRVGLSSIALRIEHVPVALPAPSVQRKWLSRCVHVATGKTI